MLKRGLGANASSVELDAPRAKRRRNVSGDSVVIEDATASSEQDGHQEGSVQNDHEVREEGLKVWQVVKDAVNKEGRTLSHDFLRLPSKRQYASYYITIKTPISLDEIKTRLEANAYHTLEALRQDFELCFKNAKKFNMRESQIWKDAKALQKIANKEIFKLTHSIEEEEVDIIDPDHESDEEGGGGNKKKKSKGPNMTRFLKGRLQKLVSKTDDDGRVLSNVFMDLPSKKKWPIYYKTIKRPICLEDIFKKIKRKEYETIADFTSDVDLVFSNALLFNEDHTPIWEDAIFLRDFFRAIMKDLPPPFSLTSTSVPDQSTLEPSGVNKIMLKLPSHSGGSAATATSVPEAGQPPAANGSQAANVPQDLPITGSATLNGASAAASGKTISSIVTKAASNSPKPAPATLNAVAPVSTQSAKAKVPLATQAYNSNHTQQAQTPAHASTSTYSFAGNHYSIPHAYYQSHAVPAATTASKLPPAVPTSASHSHTSTPTPSSVNENARTLRFVQLSIHPLGRKMELDSREGVRTWAMRLAGSEDKVTVSDVRFFGEIEEKSEGEEEEEEEEESSEEEVRKGRKGKGRANTQANSKSTNKDKESTKIKREAKPIMDKEPSSSSSSVDDIIVKWDGSQVTAKFDAQGEWCVEVAVGRHVLEVGQKGAVTWKVHIERRY